MGRIRIGISGWRYKNWRGTFYPQGLPQRRELEYASHAFSTVEINGSFYSLQRPEFYQRWYAETPDDFVFAIKGSRYITHMKRLRDAEVALANFFASGVLCLDDKLGPVLWQLPPTLRFEEALLDEFFSMLPRDTDSASHLANRHDQRLAGRSFTTAKRRRPLLYAVEVRHESFRAPEFIALLRRHRIALVVADTAGKWPYMEDVTAPFVYVRLHGDVELYASGYSRAAIVRWAEKIHAWSLGQEPKDPVRVSPKSASKRTSRDVYVYFDNDMKVKAPSDAADLIRELGVSVETSSMLHVTKQ